MKQYEWLLHTKVARLKEAHLQNQLHVPGYVVFEEELPTGELDATPKLPTLNTLATCKMAFNGQERLAMTIPVALNELWSTHPEFGDAYKKIVDELSEDPCAVA